MRAVRRTRAALVAAALVLAGCGGDEVDPVAPAPTSDPPEARAPSAPAPPPDAPPDAKGP